MSSLKLDIVTAEGMVYSDEVDVVVAPGIEGQLGILSHHAPLMTILQSGCLIARKSGEEGISLSISGGFLEVRPDRVIVLADAAERAEEIDIQRAEEAKRRAEEQLKHPSAEVDVARAEAALHRALSRLQVVEQIKRRKKRI